MALTEKIIASIEDISNERKIRKKEKYITGFASFDAPVFYDVLRRVEKTLEPILKKGEKIKSELQSGQVWDCGLKQFEIKKGFFFEVYDYSTMTACFIRLYQIHDGKKEWNALYIDENPSTPWWE